MTCEEFYEEIWLGLGGNLIDVELTEKDYELAFKKAKRTFIQKGANNMRRQFFRLRVNTCSQEYQIPKSIDTIVKIIKPHTGFTLENPLSQAAYEELFFGMDKAALGGGFDFLSYELVMGRAEMFHRFMAYDTQFHHDKHRGTIRFLKSPERDGHWLLDCYTILTDEEYMDVLWIQSWALAEAKEMLGSAYRKFSGIPDPMGGTVSLGGDQLISEAQEMKRQLLEDILNGVDADPSFYEIRLG